MALDKDEEQRKWKFLEQAPTNDAQTDEIRELCALIGAIARRSAHPEWCFCSLALALARDCIAYQLDTDRVGREQIDGYTDPQGPADLAFTRGVDDCDAKARFFVAICLAGGFQSEMVPRWKGEQLSHVYARVFCRGPSDQQKRWWFAETILRRARLGDVAEQVPKELETGNWLF
jgi:hypothetical protein